MTENCNFIITKYYKELPDERVVTLRIETPEKLPDSFFEELIELVNKHTIT